MRVISQDGTIDVPYEYFSLSVAGGKYKDVEYACIYCHNISAPHGTRLAEYSSKAKAINAMEMLREVYNNNEFYHCTATTNTFQETMGLLSNEKIKEVTSEYFRFPQDDEIEV